MGLRGHRAIAVDLPGHGLGAYLPESYQFPQDLDRLRTEPSPISRVTLGDFAAHVIDVVGGGGGDGPRCKPRPQLGLALAGHLGGAEPK
ncbi:alpha/beta hydrolase, partial [Kitasatospora griseola]